MKMANLTKAVLALILLMSFASTAYSQQLAFPTAEGYGKYAVGGRGGAVYEVTTLKPSGPGSLGQALDASGPRTVVFRVSGMIDGKFSIRNDNITIAGQTAPGDGICIRGSLGIGANDVIIRYIRVRANPTVETDAIGGRYKKNIIVDHVSTSWSSDEILSLYHNENVTIQWCMITEACAKGDSGHRFGGIWGNQYGTYHHNLIAHNDSRNPRWASGCGFNDYRNNVLYNWGYQSSYGAEAHQQGDRRKPPIEFSTINIVANYYKPGPATGSGARDRIAEPSERSSDDKGSWYVADNVVEGFPAVTANNWLGVDGGNYIQLNEPWPAMDIPQQIPEDAYHAVLAHAGCSIPNRDAVDARIIKEVCNGTATYGNNGIITTPNDVGGWPNLQGRPAPVDSDHDGMPDAWEKDRGLNPDDASDGAKDLNGDGYTNVEEYNNGLITSNAFVTGAEVVLTKPEPGPTDGRPRVIVTSDGEIDDECSMVRFLLYANEWDVELIVTSSSQYHWKGHKWAGDDWVQAYLKAYAKVYPNLVKHDPRYPKPDYLRARTLLGNVKAEGEMDEVTAGSQRIVEVLLDDSDKRPIWIQAWGGPNTIARALKTIEEEHPKKMAEGAEKIRLFFIWEQDGTYQSYIRPHWGKYNIPTIVSDQFVAFAYHWKKILPERTHDVFRGDWMSRHILQDHGPLCALYKAHDDGRFRSEGDSPAFLHVIPNGLRSVESPDWGGWGGRYVRVRENTWLDPVLEPGYKYPEGRWYTSTAWGRNRMRENIPNDRELAAYLKPMWRWFDAIQNDIAARADWCVKPYDQANHPPVVKLAHALDLKVRPRDRVSLSAKGTTDPDADTLIYRWWQYQEADTYGGAVEIENADHQQAALTIPNNVGDRETIHIICEVTDAGSPPLTGYQRVVVTIER
jgi:pectate lyase